MNRLTGLLLILFLVSCVANPPTKHLKEDANLDYQQAIEQAQVGQEVDRREDLRRCIKHWGLLNIERSGFPDEASGEGAILLEIANSGFPRYDYVLIDGYLLRNGSGAEVDISDSDLGRRIKDIYSNPSIDLHGSIDEQVDDGDCYYLTLRVRGKQQSIVFYGYPKLIEEGLLIRKILDTASELLE